MITQIKHTGKARSGIKHFVPFSLFGLLLEKVVNPPLYRGAPHFTGGHEPKERPCGLGSGAFPLPRKTGIRIRVTCFTPAIIRVLTCFQPLNRPLNIGLRRIFTQATQAFQNRPCAVNIIDAPASKPGPAIFLFSFQKSRPLEMGGKSTPYPNMANSSIHLPVKSDVPGSRRAP